MFIPELGSVRYEGRFPSAGRWPLLMTDERQRLSINLQDAPRAGSEVAIKDYSEGEGTLQLLIAHGVVLPPHRFVPSGYVEIPICHLTTAFVPSAE